MKTARSRVRLHSCYGQKPVRRIFPLLSFRRAQYTCARKIRLAPETRCPINLPYGYVIDKSMKPRISQDAKVNTLGKYLVGMCISCRLRFLNGRHRGDYTGVNSHASLLDDAVWLITLLCLLNYMTKWQIFQLVSCQRSLITVH